jgi:hypothetical protein
MTARRPNAGHARIAVAVSHSRPFSVRSSRSGPVKPAATAPVRRSGNRAPQAIAYGAPPEKPTTPKRPSASEDMSAPTASATPNRLGCRAGVDRP